MKSTRHLILSVSLAVTSTLACIGAPAVPADSQARLRTTHASLMERRAAALKKASANKNGGVKTVKPGEIKYEKRKELGNLLDRSSILCSGGYWTLVPKEAVLHVPAVYRSRVDGPRNGKLVPWSQFYPKNRGWLQTHSVSISQARGEAKMEPKAVDVYKTSGRVVVAVCQSGPISVKPLKVPDAVADTTETK